MTSGGELRLGIGDLLRRPGTQREVHRELTSDRLEITGSAVPEGATIVADLLVESTAEPGTLTVTGTLSGPWEGECRRCLAVIGGTLETDVDEIFARTPIDDEIWPLEGEEIDIATLVREAMLLALPLVPLCGPDCRGPAPDVFPATPAEDHDPDQGDEPSGGDPRWAALDQLRFDD